MVKLYKRTARMSAGGSGTSGIPKYRPTVARISTGRSITRRRLWIPSPYGGIKKEQDDEDKLAENDVLTEGDTEEEEEEDTKEPLSPAIISKENQLFAKSLSIGQPIHVEDQEVKVTAEHLQNNDWLTAARIFYQYVNSNFTRSGARKRRR